MSSAAFRRAVALADEVFVLIFCSSLAPIAYLLTLPLAELYFRLLARRFVARQQLSQHATFSRSADVADSAHCWEMKLKEGTSATNAMLRGFFNGDPSIPMRRDNLCEFLAWNMFNTTLEAVEADAAQNAALERMVDSFEAVLGPLPKGRDPRLTCVRYTLDLWPASCYKPLFCYIVMQVLRQALGFFLRLHGYELKRAGRLHYWCREARRSLRRPEPPTPKPIVLLHGVLGMLPYALLLRELSSMHDGAIVAPIFPHCSLMLEHICGRLGPPHDAAELIAAMRTIVARYHNEPGNPTPKAAFLAHSLGTGYLAPLVRKAPDLVAAVGLVDPICFSLPDGSVLHNYLYASPRLGLRTWYEPDPSLNPNLSAASVARPCPRPRFRPRPRPPRRHRPYRRPRPHPCPGTTGCSAS